MPSVLIAGCGELGCQLARSPIVAHWSIYGLRRDVSALPDYIAPIAADLSEARQPAAWPAQLDYVVYCPAPAARNEQAYRQVYLHGLAHLLGWLAAAGQPLKRLIVVSSSAVYGQNQGQWLDENAPAQASSPTAQILLSSEQLALSCAHPASVLRLSGLYGPGRRHLLEQVRAGRVPMSTPPLYSNRIHLEDAAALLAQMLQHDALGRPLEPCYLGVDDEPASLQEVVAWLRAQLGVTHLHPEPLNRQVGSKRLSNARAKTLGWAPRYPSFREGYAAQWTDAPS